jgi:23S rRNA (pseudouridine1915-N3)-methyltransferase
MRINILSIGKFQKNDNYEKIFNEYKKRILWKIDLKELNIHKKLTGETLRKSEGEKLLQNVNASTKIISLDERGAIITSIDFANLIQSYQLNGFSNIDFIIGGADGLSEEVRNKSDYILSFGKMVFPHLMIRIMLIEQLYRTYAILNNHPYHK